VSDLFHADGCVKANISTKRYNVTVVGNCQHTRIRQALITLDAETAADAVTFVQTWLRIPQTYAASVESAPCKVCGSKPVTIHSETFEVKPRFDIACGHDRTV
jgi:hypothetical protein